MIQPQYTTIRDLQRNYKKVSKEIQKTNNPIIVLSKNQPQFVLISLEKLAELQKHNSYKPAQNLLKLATWAEENNVKGPKDLSTNLDKYIWGEKTG